MQQLDELLVERGGNGTFEHAPPEREIYEEEQKKIDGWKEEVKDQVRNK